MIVIWFFQERDFKEKLHKFGINPLTINDQIERISLIWYKEEHQEKETKNQENPKNQP